MLTADQYEQKLVTFSKKEIIKFSFDNSFLCRENNCQVCNSLTRLNAYKRSIDKFAWRYNNFFGNNYNKYLSIRTVEFLYNLNSSLSTILRVLVKLTCRQPLYSVKLSIDLNEIKLKNYYKGN